MDIFAMYLRKSRGEGDVLDRHRKNLHELAEYNGHTIVAEYAEIASGDSLAARPEAQRLLIDVMSGKYAGVYCMDLDRLSRGAAEDQAAIIRAFQASGTKIITPGKVYDFNTPTDEDFGEIKLMFSRIEYKTVNRRLYTGRERSAKDGGYIGARKVYGYNKVPRKAKEGPTLEVYPEQAEVVVDIFQMYADGMSSHKIADKLNAGPMKPNYSEYWSPDTIRGMLRNPVYIGKISWGKKISKPAPDGSKKRVNNTRAILSDGKHPAIVSDSLWKAVQARLEGNAAPPTSTLQNPLRGLVRCARCGRTMQRHDGTRYDGETRRADALRCPNRQCDQPSAGLAVIENMILRFLDSYYVDSEPTPLQARQRKDRQKAAKLIQDQIKQAEAQQSRQADLLEQGVYSVEDFIARRNALSERLRELHRRYDETVAPDLEDQAFEAWRDIVPRSMTVSEAYRRAPDNETRNALLAALVRGVTYDKEGKRRSRHDDPEHGITIQIDLMF